VQIHIVQGERAMATDNKSLGQFMLDGIPPAPRGMPQVEVTFDIDANGILNVKAKDKTTNKEQSIRIEASSGLTDADIKRMTADAEAHEEEDRKKKEMIEARNSAEQLVYTAEKALKDNGDKIDAALKSDVEAKIAEVKKIKDGEDITALKTATDELSSHLSKVGEAMSKQASTEAPKPEEGAGEAGEQTDSTSTDEAK
jgi:molecular chaperone DnaK